LDFGGGGAGKASFFLQFEIQLFGVPDRNPELPIPCRQKAGTMEDTEDTGEAGNLKMSICTTPGWDLFFSSI
jgi:hypothetical protein